MHSIILNEEVNRAIKSRAKMLSNRFYFLDYEDLVQDGYELVYQLIKKYGEGIHIMMVLKSINNHFCDVEDKAVVRKKRNVNTSSIPAFEEQELIDESPTQEDELAREQEERIFHKSLEETDKRVLEALNSGDSFKKISTTSGLKEDTIKRRLKRILERKHHAM